MDLFSDLISALQSDLTIDSNSTMYPPTTVKLALNRAYRKAASMFKWPETMDALETSAIANQEYYDVPSNWKANSSWRLEVDGVDYGNKIAFEDYLYEKANNFPSGYKKMWATQARRVFIYPTPTANGVANISVWGIKTVDALVNDNDITIFSYSMPECNDAIVEEGAMILKRKGENLSEGQFFSQSALQTLTIAYNKIKQDKDKAFKSQPAYFIPDMFSSTGGLGGNSNRYNIGNFDPNANNN